MTRIYWRSKEGLSPPPNARFSISPFIPGAPLPIDEIVHSLPFAKSAQIIHRIDSPNREEWTHAVHRALREIDSGNMKKVVLARETTLHLNETVDPFQIAAALPTKGAALFCVDFGNGAFLGATPERLFRKNGRIVQVEAMASTRRKHQTAAEFLTAEKEQREFQFVQHYLDQTLAPFCTAPLLYTPLSTHKTQTVEHLYTRGETALAPNVSEEVVLQALHPTPALCGTPKQAALQWIQESEPFQRGYYGGYLGWSNGAASDYMVAIRCCLLQGRIAKLYTGTGIVAGSDPDAEWDELEAKLSLYKKVFQCGP